MLSISGKLEAENLFSYKTWICIYPSLLSFYTGIVQVVPQIQYDAPWKLFDTYLAGRNVASIK